MSLRRANRPRKNEREGSLGNILEELVHKTEPEDSQLVQFDGPQPVTFSAGTPYDSGYALLPNLLSVVVTAVPTKITAIILSNLTAQIQGFSIADNIGNSWIVGRELEPNEFLVLELHGAEWDGIVWIADAANSIAGQIVGEQ